MAEFDAWSEKLRRAALPGAARIVFGRTTKAEDRSVSYSMNSYDAAGDVIGDDRDYDMLKVVFSPLETLSEAMEGDFLLEMDLESGVVKPSLSI